MCYSVSYLILSSVCFRTFTLSFIFYCVFYIKGFLFTLLTNSNASIYNLRHFLLGRHLRIYPEIQYAPLLQCVRRTPKRIEYFVLTLIFYGRFDIRLALLILRPSSYSRGILVYPIYGGSISDPRQF